MCPKKAEGYAAKRNKKSGKKYRSKLNPPTSANRSATWWILIFRNIADLAALKVLLFFFCLVLALSLKKQIIRQPKNKK
jgi:hypothetical protein